MFEVALMSSIPVAVCLNWFCFTEHRKMCWQSSRQMTCLICGILRFLLVKTIWRLLVTYMNPQVCILHSFSF